MPTTRAKARARARITETVLSTPELLTLILSHLPPHDLLLNAQLTNKTWHSLTKSTPLLRQTLFLDPSPSHPPTLNPLLIKAFPIFFSNNPISPADFHQLPFTKNLDAFKRKGASWREMLPLSSGGEVRAVRRWCQMGGSSEIVGKVEAPGGMKMGICWDVTRTMCGPRSASIYWCWRDDVGLGEEDIFGKYERGYEETEELEIRVQSSIGCVATTWDEEAERAAEREERKREEEDRYFRCEGVGEIDVQYGTMRETYETMRYRLMLPEYQREMDLAASLPLPDDDEDSI